MRKPASLRIVAALACALIGLGVGVQPALASGSANLWPNGASGNRANTEWRTSSYGGGLLTRRTLIKAFVNAGEVLMLGSSAIAQGTSDILVWNPGLVTGSIGSENVSAVPSFTGNRATIAAELAKTLRYSRLSLVQTWLNPNCPIVCQALSASPINSGSE